MQIALRRSMVQRMRCACADVWPIDPQSATAPPGWQGWPEKKRFALVLTHDVETDKGYDNVLRLVNLEEQLGFRSSFGFVPERYVVASDVREYLCNRGFEVVLHGLRHDGKYYRSEKTFRRRAKRINHYLKEWGVRGFRSPSMLHNLDWLCLLEIEYDLSTFDTDPFEPQPDGVGTIFPFFVPRRDSDKGIGYLELPYTLPQDFTLFIIMREQNIGIWRQKLDWIAEHGGMALTTTHPDYMRFNGEERGAELYPVERYVELLDYVKKRYEGQYWHALPNEVAKWCQKTTGMPCMGNAYIGENRE
jgi:hypothetical protein